MKSNLSSLIEIGNNSPQHIVTKTKTEWGHDIWIDLGNSDKDDIWKAYLDLVYQHIPTYVFLLPFSAITWPLKFVVYLFNKNVTPNAYFDHEDDPDYEYDYTQEELWFVDWMMWDAKQMFPAWWMWSQVWTFGKATPMSTIPTRYDASSIAFWYVWASLWFIFEWVIDACLVIILSPVYLIDLIG